MFVVFNVIQPVKGFFKHRKQKKYIAENGLHTVRNEKGLPFYILDIIEEKRGIDWKSVSAECGRYASRVIAPRNIILPDESDLKRFVPLSMNSVLIFNTAKEIIKNADLPPDKFSITLTDRNANHPSRILDLLPLSSQIRVVTAYPERYASVCAKALEEFGASLIIRPSYEKTSKPDAVICTDGAITSEMNSSAVFVSKRKTGGKILFSGSQTELLPKHKEILPQNIDAVDFAGALTELCGCPEYKNSVFSEIQISCQKCQNASAENCFKCFVK